MPDIRSRLESALGSAYRFEYPLGSGSMSRVFVAEDIVLGRRVVVKVLSPEMAASISAKRFEQEIQFAARLQHPHIVPLLTAGEADGLPYFTMPFVEGESLRAYLDRVGELPIVEVVRLLRDVATALAYAHEHGVIHRDIKPDNVLLTGGQAVVTDFGVAKAMHAAAPDAATVTVTAAEIAIGTPAYMAPEQAAGDQVDHRADIYAFGVMAYEMLTGALPFPQRSLQAVLAAHAAGAPPPIWERRESVPSHLGTLVMQCLEKRPADRPQSAADIVRLLEGVSTPDEGAIRKWTTQHLRTRRARRRAAIVAGVAALVAALAVALWRGGPWTKTRATEEATEATGGGPGRPGGLAGAVSSLAVLPFRNTSNDSTNEYFADGISDEFTSTLSRVPGLRVASRTSSFTFKGRRDLDVREIARRLNVGFVLEGSVARRGSQITVSAQLTNARDGLTIWAGTFDRKTSAAFQLQDDVSRAIVSALNLRVPAAGSVALAKRGTSDPVAHDLYLRGRARFHMFTDSSLRESIGFYEQALRRDPKFAEAWAAIAESWLFLADDYEPPRVAYPAAKAAALKALGLDSTVSSAHAALGNALYAYNWDLAAGERELRKAIELDPNDFVVMLSYHGLMIAKGRQDSALAVLQHAQGIDPLSPIEALFLGRFYGITGRPDEAIKQYERAQELEPNLAPFAAIAIGELYLALGKRSEAEKAFATARQMLGGQLEYLFAAGEASLGHRELALKLVHELEAEARRRYIRPETIAGVYVRLGDRDAAFRWLERAFEARSPYLLALKIDRQWDPIRTDPRYASLVTRIGLP